MPDEDTSESPFEVVAKSADPTLDERGEQIGEEDDEDSEALGWEMDENQNHGLMNPSKIARTYEAKRKMKESADPWTLGEKATSLLDSPADSKERLPPEPCSPKFNSRLKDLRLSMDGGITPNTLDEYMSKCFSLKGILRLVLFFVFFLGLYKTLGRTVPTKREFKFFKKEHYQESKESFPSFESWPLRTDSTYYKQFFERIKYKDYGLVALARTVQEPAHHFLGFLGTWFPMPYIPTRTQIIEIESSWRAPATTKTLIIPEWGVCLAGRCVCVPEVKPVLDFSKCELAVWNDSWTKTAIYGGFVAGIAVWSNGMREHFCLTLSSFVNPFYWFTFLTAPFLHKSWVDMVSTIVFTVAVAGAVQNNVKTNFELWAIFYAGSFAYGFGSLLMTWILNDWTSVRRYYVSGAFGGLAAWLGYLTNVSDQPLFSWQFASLVAGPLNVQCKDLFVAISILDAFDSRSAARFGGLGMAFFVGKALHTFFVQPFPL